MNPPGGKRSSLASYSWGRLGSQNDVIQYRQTFQPDQGIFSPGYPLVPPESERVRVWDFPVGYNTIYTPRVPTSRSGFMNFARWPNITTLLGWRLKRVKIRLKSLDGGFDLGSRRSRTDDAAGAHLQTDGLLAKSRMGSSLSPVGFANC